MKGRLITRSGTGGLRIKERQGETEFQLNYTLLYFP